MPPAQLVRKSYTPRDEVLDGRFNVKLIVKADVPDNSYFFTGAFVEKLKVDEESVDKLRKLAYEYLSGSLSMEKLIRGIDENYKKIFSSKPSASAPRVGGKVVIPGSVLKGAVRSRIEYKLSPSVSCYSVMDQKLSPQLFSKNHLKFWGDEVGKSEGRLSCDPEEGVCYVCDIFGAPGLSSRVFFSDAEMVKGGTVNLRDLGIEAIRPGSSFTFEIDCFNFNFVDLGLVFLGLEVFTKSPVLMGAYKYRYLPKFNRSYNGYAFGLVKFTVGDVKEVFTKVLEGLSLREIVGRAEEELKKELGGRVNFDRGVLR